MEILHTVTVKTPYGEKTISAVKGSVLDLGERIDVLTVSAFIGDYSPVPRTLCGALFEAGIDLYKLAGSPFIDLRAQCGVWLSEAITGKGLFAVGRIGCLEMLDFSGAPKLDDPLQVIKAYFRMLELAALAGVPIKTVALPLLGSGDQSISPALTLIPIINECTAFLRRTAACDRILLVDINEKKAKAFADALSSTYSLLDPEESIPKKEELLAFISYSSKDRNIADNLCNKLESRGIRVWYAPRNVSGPYASAIMRGIAEATHFIVIVSESSLASQHVLNEIDNAHMRLPALKFKPLRLEDIALTPEFSYYLSRQHWMDAFLPPLEERLESFADDILSDL